MNPGEEIANELLQQMLSSGLAMLLPPQLPVLPPQLPVRPQLPPHLPQLPQLPPQLPVRPQLPPQLLVRPQLPPQLPVRPQLPPQLPQLQVFPYCTQGMLKTEMCNRWMAGGICPYGRACHFAHGPLELRTVIRHPRYKTIACSYFRSGGCMYGSRCHFRHDRGR